MVASAVFAAGPESGQRELQLQQAELEHKLNQIQDPGQGAPAKPSRTGVLIVPQYYHTHNSAMTTNLADGLGGRLKMGSGNADGGGFVFLATKEVNETLALSFFYQFIAMKYTGGALQPNSIPGLRITEKNEVISNGVGLFADLNLKSFGRLQASVIQGFDDYSGTQRIHMNGVQVGTNSMDNFSDRITSLMLWYERDAPLNANWTLTPYAGWRSVYAHLDNPLGEAEPRSDNTWVHLMSGGLKLGYRNGLFGFGLHGGVNYRISEDDIPGFGIRMPAPNTDQPGYNVHLDRTVGSFGVNVSYAFPGYCALFAGGDTAIGGNTDAQVARIGIAIPF